MPKLFYFSSGLPAKSPLKTDKYRDAPSVPAGKKTEKIKKKTPLRKRRGAPGVRAFGAFGKKIFSPGRPRVFPHAPLALRPLVPRSPPRGKVRSPANAPNSRTPRPRPPSSVHVVPSSSPRPRPPALVRTTPSSSPVRHIREDERKKNFKRGHPSRPSSLEKKIWGSGGHRSGPSSLLFSKPSPLQTLFSPSTPHFHLFIITKKKKRVLAGEFHSVRGGGAKMTCARV